MRVMGWVGTQPYVPDTPHGGTFTSMMKILSSQFWPIPAIAPLSGAGPLNGGFRERSDCFHYLYQSQIWKRCHVNDFLRIFFTRTRQKPTNVSFAT